jgi:hypothetical protein
MKTLIGHVPSEIEIIFCKIDAKFYELKWEKNHAGYYTKLGHFYLNLKKERRGNSDVISIMISSEFFDDIYDTIITRRQKDAFYYLDSMIIRIIQSLYKDDVFDEDFKPDHLKTNNE